VKVSILGKNGLKVVDLNRRKAIRERCLNCTGWSYKEVVDCIFSDCPLYPFRIGRGKQNAINRSKNIREYCKWCMNGQPSEVSKCTSHDCSLWPYRKITTDRSSEIESLPKNGYIVPCFERKTEKTYLRA